MSERLQREIRVVPREDGNCLRWEFLLHGQLGTVQFIFHELKVPGDSRYGYGNYGHMPIDLGFHWDRKPYKHVTKMACKYRESGRCFYDGSGLNANDLYQRFKVYGSDIVWAELEDYYDNIKGEN